MTLFYFALILIGIISPAFLAYEFFKLQIDYREKIFLSIPLGNIILIHPYFLINFFNLPLNKGFYYFATFISCSYFLYKVINFLRNSFRNIDIRMNFKIFTMLILLIYCYLRIMSFPVNTNDALSYWSFYSKVFFHEKTIYSDALTNEDRVLRAKNYPLFVSLTETYLCYFFNSFDDKKIKFLFFLYYFSFLGLYYYRLKNYVNDKIAFIFSFLLFSLPPLVREETGGISSAMVDVPLAFFSTISLMYLYEFLVSKKNSFLLLSIFFISASIFIKNEGIAIYFVMAASLLIFGWRKKKLLIKCKSFFLYPFLINIPWLYFKYFVAVPIRTYKGLELHSFTDLFLILANIIRNWAGLINWGLIWIIFFLLFFLIRAMEENDRFVLLFIIFQFASYLIALMIIPWDYVSALPIDRLSIHLLPEVLFLFVLVSFKKASS